MLGMNSVGNQEICHPPYKQHKTTPLTPLSRLQQAHDENALVHDTAFMHPTCSLNVRFELRHS